MRYFELVELVPCADGHCRDRRCGNDENVVGVPAEVIHNVTALVEHVLDPARERLGRPVKVNSGYRCPLKNKAIGGAANSQHLKGEAADITAGSPDENLKLARILIENGDYDQVVLYLNTTTSLKPCFIHVTWKRNGCNRHKVLKKVIGGAPVYTMLTQEELDDINDNHNHITGNH